MRADMARDVGEQHAPGFRIVEGAPQRDMQLAIDDRRAQDFERRRAPARLGGNVERIELRMSPLVGLVAHR